MQESPKDKIKTTQGGNDTEHQSIGVAPRSRCSLGTASPQHQHGCTPMAVLVATQEPPHQHRVTSLVPRVPNQPQRAHCCHDLIGLSNLNNSDLTSRFQTSPLGLAAKGRLCHWAPTQTSHHILLDLDKRIRHPSLMPSATSTQQQRKHAAQRSEAQQKTCRDHSSAPRLQQRATCKSRPNRSYCCAPTWSYFVKFKAQVHPTWRQQQQPAAIWTCMLSSTTDSCASMPIGDQWSSLAAYRGHCYRTPFSTSSS